MFTKIFKNITNKKNSDDQLPEPEQQSSNVRVIGARSSGKTTYMAALARWPNADPTISAVQTVIPINENGEKLIELAKNILEQGDRLEPTPLVADVYEVKDYSIQIVLKQNFSRRRNKLVNLNINCKDYSGEFFEDILHQTGTPLLENYLNDCLEAEGIMLLLDGLAHRQDSQYANGLEKFLMELDRAEIGGRERRIALVLTKCEQPELWVNRHQPYKIAKARFPEVVRKLNVWEQSGPGSIEYFTVSAFGMVGERYPAPNMTGLSRTREGIKTSVLKYPQRWKPFGLVAPIYWLCTGERNEQLDLE